MLPFLRQAIATGTCRDLPPSLGLFFFSFLYSLSMDDIKIYAQVDNIRHSFNLLDVSSMIKPHQSMGVTQIEKEPGLFPQDCEAGSHTFSKF